MSSALKAWLAIQHACSAVSDFIVQSVIQPLYAYTVFLVTGPYCFWVHATMLVCAAFLLWRVLHGPRAVSSSQFSRPQNSADTRSFRHRGPSQPRVPQHRMTHQLRRRKRQRHHALPARFEMTDVPLPQLASSVYEEEEGQTPYQAPDAPIVLSDAESDTELMTNSALRDDFQSDSDSDPDALVVPSLYARETKPPARTATDDLLSPPASCWQRFCAAWAWCFCGCCARSHVYTTHLRLHKAD